MDNIWFDSHVVKAVKFVTQEELIAIMSKFTPKLTAGDDLIPSPLVYDYKSVFAKPLALIIINLFLKLVIFPDYWKRLMWHKWLKLKIRIIYNNRQISIPSNLAKVMKQVLHKSIYANVKSYLSPEQHGFINGRSTITNLWMTKPR